MNITEKKYLIQRCVTICRDLVSKERDKIFGKHCSEYSPLPVTRKDILSNLKKGKIKPFSKEDFIKQYEKVADNIISPDIINFIHGYKALVEENAIKFKVKKDKLDKFKADIDKKLQDIKDEIMLGTSKEYALKLIKTLEDTK
jgi:hypothetical protein